MDLRPSHGGWLRPFGTGWFIREYLLGHGPEGSPRIDPAEGACIVDIFYEYKRALHRAYARDALGREIEEREKRGLPFYTEEEWKRRFEYHFRRISYKLAKCRYHSFHRYFHYLVQLGWVEPTGATETSTLEEMTGNPAAQPRRYYCLTEKGKRATEEEWSNPQRELYAFIGKKPWGEWHRTYRSEVGKKYRRKKRRERWLRPYTAGMFIRDYLLGLGPEGAPKIDPDKGDWCENIFFHYKEMLRRAYARDAVAYENEERVREGKEPYSREEYEERLQWHLNRIPYKLHRARYYSFWKYFNELKALGFIEPTGETETSEVQWRTPEAAPRVFYRISKKGKEAPWMDWHYPLVTLYLHFDKEYFAEKRKEEKEKLTLLASTEAEKALSRV